MARRIMQMEWQQGKTLRAVGLPLAVVTVLLLGLWFRFTHLDTKVLWGDEVLTVVRTSGYTASEVLQDIAESPLTTVQSLQRYHVIAPNTGLDDVTEDFRSRSRPPLYYVLLYFWRTQFGDSVAIIRSLSALLNLLVLPCLYWLCWELFQSRPVGLVAMALFLVSPLQVLYAQEAREYSLLMLAIVLSSALLLRSLRLHTPLNWAGYALTVAMGIYTQWLFGMVVVSHALYGGITQSWCNLKQVHRSRLTRTRLIAYGVSTLLGLSLLIPWLRYSRFQLLEPLTDGGWRYQHPATPWTLLHTWVLNQSRLCFDVNDSAIFNGRLPIYLGLLILMGYAFYWLCRKAPFAATCFVFTLAGVPTLALALPDLLTGSTGSTAPRYLLPTYLAMQLALAFLLAPSLNQAATQKRRQRLWQGMTVLLLSLGVISCWRSAPVAVWWNKYTGGAVVEMAEQINQAERPLLLTNAAGIMALSFVLHSQVPVYWVTEERAQLKNLGLSEPLTNFTDLFWYPARRGKAVSAMLRRTYPLQRTRITYRVDPAYNVNVSLWHLSQPGRSTSLPVEQ
ncbi:MAG: glycosyltransferase family 39 protein [Synechococcales cyanobacterium C42_A2020_086]|nr:glycosyltransferase family 39 protein [Synechococcales cyanobacterium C42_A2020_086]